MVRVVWLFLFLSGAGIIFLLQSCQPDKPFEPLPTDPDSLYIGTPHTLLRPFRFPDITHPYKDKLTDEGIELGRRLYYDVRLSRTGQLSCASCHKQEFAFSDAGNATSTNVFGATRRNAPAMQNMLWGKNFFWDGRVTTLTAQAQDAFHGEQDLNIPDAINYLQADTMYAALFKKAFGRPGLVTEENMNLALQQFMMVMISSNSKFDRVQRGETQFTPSELNGFTLFSTERGDCFHCHSDGASVLFTNNLFHNNGLDSATSVSQFADIGRGEATGVPDDFGKFKSMTLRNIALTEPYMHDGRFQTLEEVIDFYSAPPRQSPTLDAIMLKANHQGQGLNFTEQEKTDLINFLHTLTDTSFTNNPAYSSPF